jgi:hypothetical protein
MLQPHADGDLYFWDQLAAAILIEENLAGFETMTLSVTTDGGPDTVGVTRRTPDGHEVRVAVTVDAARFEREFLSSLAGEDVGSIATPPKLAAATAEDLLMSLLAAADAGEADTWVALCSDDVVWSTYLATEGTGRLNEPSSTAEWDPRAEPMPPMDVLGEPLVVGDTAAIAVRYSRQGESPGDAEGFVVIAGDRAADGLLVASAANFFGMGEPPANATIVQELMEALAGAWNADDVDGMLATMTDDVVIWGDLSYPDAIDSGPMLRDVLAGAFALQAQITGPPVTSGPFAAMPMRFTDETSDASRDVITVLWIRDGRIAMMALALGQLQG